MGMNDPNTTPAPTTPMPTDSASATLDKSVFVKAPTAPENDKQKAFAAAIPDDFKHKEHFQNMLKTEDPFSEMFKQYESAQSMLGQRTGLQVPTAESTPEQVKEWRKAIGVPEETTDYVVKPIEWADEDKPFGKLVTDNRVGEVMTKLGAKAHELGLTPAQFQTLAETYDKEMVNGLKTTMTEQVKAQVEKDRDFTERVKTIYGDKAQQVLDDGRKLLEANVPKEVLEELHKAPPVALQALTVALASVGKKYIREDNFNSGGGVSAPPAYTTMAQVSEKANQMRKTLPGYYDNKHAQHKESVKKVDDFYEANRALLSKK